MDFNKARQKMWDAYVDLERKLIEISRIIPWDNHSDTYSPELYNILQSSCSHVVNLMRLICDNLNLKYENDDFPSLYKVLDGDGILLRQMVDAIDFKAAFQPFNITSGMQTPAWWKAYNDTKHNLPEGFKAGTIQNTISAMTALYSLHCIAYYVGQIGKDVLQMKAWRETDSITYSSFSKEIPRLTDDERPPSKVFYPISYYLGTVGI